MPVAVPIVFVVGAIAAVLASPPALAAAQAQVAAAPQAPIYKVLRSTSGSKGHVAGPTYVVDDPRTVFRVPEDRQIIVHFEWEGPAGKHRMEGLWRNPGGRVSTISDFTHESRGGRFGAYWELALPESVPTGTWTLEARIDGQPAGTHTFEIVAGAGGPRAAAPPPRQPLSAAELYQRIHAATVVVHKLDAAGRVGLVAAGFAIAPDRVAMPFHVVDGASRLRLTSPAGQTEDVTRVAAFDRLGDWAIVPIATLTLKPLGRPATREAGVGSALYSLNIAPTGERTIYDVLIGGTSARPGAGERLVLQVPVGWRSAGTPLIDAYGDAVGIVGAIWEPGTALHDPEGRGFLAAPSAVPLQLGGTSLAVAIERVVDDGKGARELAELASSVPFIPMIGPSSVHVMRGTTAQSAKRATGFFETVDTRASFSKARGPFAVVLDLMPRDKLKGLLVAVTLYAPSGQRIAATKPLAVKGEPNRPLGVSWAIDAAALPPGVYRLDVGGDADVMWRTFIEITP